MKHFEMSKILGRKKCMTMHETFRNELNSKKREKEVIWKAALSRTLPIIVSWRSIRLHQTRWKHSPVRAQRIAQDRVTTYGKIGSSDAIDSF